MEKIAVPQGPPTQQQLHELEERCNAAIKRAQAPDSEVRLPLVIEFTGSPKSGKTSIIGIVSHFLKRMGASVHPPVEGASLRTPAPLRDDWLAFNAWSGCYALQQILIDCSLEAPPLMVILDRGLFDVAGWMRFLANIKRLTEDDHEAMVNFFSLDLWRRRENAVFLFTCDAKTSMRREIDSKLTAEVGSVMNEQILREIQDAYIASGADARERFSRMYHIDTSDNDSGGLSFQQIAFQVATRIVEMIEELSTQILLVTAPVSFEGFEQAPDVRKKTVEQILNGNLPRFLPREIAEKTLSVQQVVPYAILENGGSRYFWAKRRADSRHAELKSRWTLLVGGHAERRDWDELAPEGVFERCLRRELEEELIGLQVLEIEPLGFINDSRNAMGSHHLAFIHRVKVGGRTSLRRQAIDQEFGRGSIEWKTVDEIACRAEELDPWSQLVAVGLFGAKLPFQTQLFAPKTP